MLGKIRLNQVVILFFVYLVNICQPVWAQSCSAFYAASDVASGVRRIDDFFLGTRSFANLIERQNGFQVDDKGSEYQKFVSELSAKINRHVKEIEKVIGEKEVVLISTVASRGDLVIKFARSKTYLLFAMNWTERERKYDEKWDRDYIVETRHKHKDLTSLFLSMKNELDKFRPFDSEQSICRSVFCRFFQHRKAETAFAPEIFKSLGSKDRMLVQKLYFEYLATLNATFKWSKIKNQDGRYLKASDYKRFGLNQYLGARRIPNERWLNYRVNSFGEIEVNLVAEPFEYAPWGSDKSYLIAGIAEDLQTIQKFPEPGNAALLFTHFIKDFRPDIESKDFSYLDSQVRNNIFNNIVRLNSEIRGQASLLTESLQKLAIQLEKDHQRYRERQRKLLEIVRTQSQPNIDQDYFEVEGQKIPIVAESSLSDELREYLEIDFNLAKAKGSHGNHPKRLNDSQSLFRAVFHSESDQIKSNGYFDITPETNFEPRYGFQVNYFKIRNGYSGDVVEVKNVPRFLLVESPSNDFLHPEIRLRFPIRTRQLEMKR